jgi:RNA polymerase sigma factor (sigma-70 family)
MTKGMHDDGQLLRRFVETGSQADFDVLVQRHMDLVFGVALRMTRNSQRAEDVAQTVFVDLWRKARRLCGRTDLAGWLYLTTWYASKRLVRGEARRDERERALGVGNAEDTAAVDPAAFATVVDHALRKLSAADRDAVVLRFFQNRSFVEVGAALGLTEGAARMRVQRAVERLRQRFSRQGIISTVAALECALDVQAATKAPLGLATKIAGATTVATVGTSTVGGILSLMSITKTAMTGIGIAAIVALGGYYHERQARVAADNAVNDLTRENIGLKREIAQMEKRRPSSQGQSVPSPSSVAAPQPPQQSNAILGSLPITPTDAQLAQAHQKYDPFLKQHGLTPDQIDQFCYLMAEKDLARNEVQAGIRAQGLIDSPVAEQLSSEAAQPYWDQMKAMLGPEAWQDFPQYEKSYYYQTAFLAPVLTELSSANDPLNAAQQQTLAGIIAANDHPYKANPSDIGSRSEIDWVTVVAQASPVLDSNQVAILREHAQREMAKSPSQ